MTKFLTLFAGLFMSMNIVASEPTISFPPNIKTLIDLPGKKETMEIFLPAQTDTYHFFNESGLYSKDSEGKSYYYRIHKYADLKKNVETLKPVEGGSLLKLNIMHSTFNDLSVTNEKGNYIVAYDFSYGYVTKVKLDIIVQSEYEFDYGNGNLKQNEEDITRSQKVYVKEKFRTELLALGYEEDTPFFSFLAKENTNRRTYVKDKSIIKVLDAGYDSKYMNAITVYFENKDINDNLNTIKNIKNDEKFKELQNMFK